MTVKPKPAKAQKSLRSGLVETEILEHAARIFSERGYAATSLQDLAADLKLSRASLYYYFSNKEEILIRLVGDLVVSSEGALSRIQKASKADPPAHLKFAVEALLVPVVESPSRFRLLLTSEADLPAALAKRWRAVRRSIVQEVSTLIGEGIQSGHFRALDEHVATFTVLGMCNWVAWWPSRHRENISAVASGIGEIAVAGMITAGGPSEADSLQELAQARKHLERAERLIAAHPGLLTDGDGGRRA